MTKKQRQLFLAKAKALLLALGATQNGNDFILQTKAGKLTLFPAPNETIGLGTLFTRFDDPRAARQFVDCNRFSGKWNHHFFENWTDQTAIADFEFQLKKIIS